MSYDTEYNAGLSAGPDNIVDTDNNYRQISGATSKVGRCVVAEYKVIDGIPFGNKAWVELARAQDTPSNRQLLVYHTKNAIRWLVDNRQIKDLDVTSGDPAYTTGVALLVKYTDVKTGETSTDGFIAPWGMT